MVRILQKLAYPKASQLSKLPRPNALNALHTSAQGCPDPSGPSWVGIPLQILLLAWDRETVAAGRMRVILPEHT